MAHDLLVPDYCDGDGTSWRVMVLSSSEFPDRRAMEDQRHLIFSANHHVVAAVRRMVASRARLMQFRLCGRATDVMERHVVAMEGAFKIMLFHRDRLRRETEKVESAPVAVTLDGSKDQRTAQQGSRSRQTTARAEPRVAL
jgi:hypothetical protein